MAPTQEIAPHRFMQMYTGAAVTLRLFLGSFPLCTPRAGALRLSISGKCTDNPAIRPGSMEKE